MQKAALRRFVVTRTRKFWILVFSVVILGVIGCVILAVATHKPRPTYTSPTTTSRTTTPPQTKGVAPGQPASPTPAAPANPVIFSDAFSGSDRILTNEYSYWNPQSACPYRSSTWEMTSGTLFVRNGVGYSGIPTKESHSVCDSSTHTDSAVFRLNTRQSNFANVKVSMDYMAIAHGGGGATNNTYDGIHMWVGYQNQYALYAASVFRWDGNAVIKKKVPAAQAGCTNTSNGGCYYDLTSETKETSVMGPNVWHYADITFLTNADATTTITEQIDGQTILQATDNNTHAAAYKAGAVGVRADNTEFYLKNFTVTQL